MNTSDLREKCGVFGIFNNLNAIQNVIFGLHALQHRGQEAAGMVVTDGTSFSEHRGLGLVSEVFQPEQISALKGNSAIGHVRYSTCGDNLDIGSALKNVQPLSANIDGMGIAIAHNGNLTNTDELRPKLARRIFQSTSDTEFVLHLMALSEKTDTISRLNDALCQLRGAYSFVILTPDELIGVRDPFGFRPLILGKVNGSFVLASETCALDIINASFIREIEPGEIVSISKDGLKCREISLPKKPSGFCLFEWVYFLRPDSIVQGKSVYAIRQEIGRQLARESKVQADVVVPVPDSGLPAAMGFGQELGIPFELGLTRSHYIGRTFIDPVQMSRTKKVRLKFNANREVISGNRIVLVDDSLVRGTTSKEIVSMIRGAGAKEVHLQISSPAVLHPCFHGMDFPQQGQLVAHDKDVEMMRQYLELDSLAFLSINGLKRAVGKKDFCTACFTGNYLEPVPQ